MTYYDPNFDESASQPSGGSTLDRRDFSRIKIEGITLIKTDSATSPIINGELIDVSASGLKITLDTPLSVGSTIKLSIFIEEEDLIFLVSGVILWCAIFNKKSDKPSFVCGIEILYEKEGSDFNDWRSLFIA